MFPEMGASHVSHCDSTCIKTSILGAGRGIRTLDLFLGKEAFYH
jgi:hypothetical protein